MNRTVCIAALAALIGAPAFAADMAVKAPPHGRTSICNWTGWYVGVDAGASMGSAQTVVSALYTVTVTYTSNPVGTVRCSFLFGFFGSTRESPVGFMGGGQIGYNWQCAPL